MTRIRPLAALLIVTTMLTAVEQFQTSAVAVPPLDAEHSEFAAVLAAVAKTDGVAYAVLRKERAALDRYRAQLAGAPAPTGKGEQLVLFINAYNASTLALVVDRLPADEASWAGWSIKKAGGTFTSVSKIFNFEVARQRYTLDAMEHAVLRPLGDPRFHMAINCASRSCPPLIAEPLRLATLDVQLEAITRAFAASPYHLRLENGVLGINPILDWFWSDFTAVGGVRAFLRTRTPAGPVADYLTGTAPMKFFDYEWELNLSTVAR
jgi:hypothetical protein